MSLIDGLLLTLLNTVACLALPKLLSVILSGKKHSAAIKSQAAIEPQESNSEIPVILRAS
ncbi:hypothetical protein WKK05_28355 [Nostoc sp. UHCC 0302]|uniref:hypothetical protein n=1 Tax=Nostoc sp. UHCC 0302 TaxID=3134896 RepID=UPI00311CE099